MSGGGKSGSDGQTLTYSLPVNGSVSMTFTSTSTQGSAAITTYAWKSNGTQICSNSSTCTAPFGTPSNTITLTVTDSNSNTSTATGQVNITHPTGPTAHFSMKRRRAERERRADPDLQPAGERQREHDLHQHQHAGERGHHHLRLEEQWHWHLQQLVDLHLPVRHAEQHDHADCDGQQ